MKKQKSIRQSLNEIAKRACGDKPFKLTVEDKGNGLVNVKIEHLYGENSCDFSGRFLDMADLKAIEHLEQIFRRGYEIMRLQWEYEFKVIQQIINGTGRKPRNAAAGSSGTARNPA